MKNTKKKNCWYLKQKGELTQFQILAEIPEQKSHIHQKDIAVKLSIIIQAVSENIKSLMDEGLIETSEYGDYRTTMKGNDKVKSNVLDLKTYVDEILELIDMYRSVWPAIAQEDLKRGDEVGLQMDEGILYTTTHKPSAYAKQRSKR